MHIIILPRTFLSCVYYYIPEPAYIFVNLFSKSSLMMVFTLIHYYGLIIPWYGNNYYFDMFMYTI